MRGLELMKQHGVEFNVLVTVSRDVAARPLDVYRFLKEAGVRFVQFNPVVERVPRLREQQAGLHFATPPAVMRPGALAFEEGSTVTPQSVAPGAYGDFLIAIF